jgi:hypothetical protein
LYFWAPWKVIFEKFGVLAELHSGQLAEDVLEIFIRLKAVRFCAFNDTKKN